MIAMIMLDLTHADGSKVYVDAFDIAVIEAHSFANTQGVIPADPRGSLITTKSGVPVLVTEQPEEVVDKMTTAAAHYAGHYMGAAQH